MRQEDLIKQCLLTVIYQYNRLVRELNRGIGWLMGILMFCAVFFCQNCDKIHWEKERKIKLYMSPRICATHTPRDASAITPLLLLLCVTGDAAEEQVTWSRVRVGQAAGLSTFASSAFMSGDLWLLASQCLMCMVYHQGKSAFCHWGCSESLPTSSSNGVGV